ncbi:MAG TPA: serine/threonine-protein kinase [Gemmataceae bacterium]|nr:serine/threonine-protein kinase [Gemmataceae bacterium]
MVGRVFLGRYETIRLLGEGGMGRVYLAKQLDLGRQVVVKVMHDHIAADPKFRERFTRETLAMARFQHPYAVTLYDASLNDPQGPCIVMEYIKGVTLDNLLANSNRLAPARVSRLLRMLCEVLQVAHAESIIHRDLKPANLMIVDPNTPYEILKVMDFGLAKLVGNDSHNNMRLSAVSNNDFAVGTPGYMCPEQARGEEMDHRGDLYSVGVILYELLTGQLPFGGKSTMDVLLAHAVEPPPAFSLLGAGRLAPPEIEEVVLWCLSKDPTDRPTSARELAERFENALAESEGSYHGEHSDHGLTSAKPRQDALYPPTQRHTAPPAATAPVAAPPPATATPEGYDPLASVHHLEAWMPETIAQFKLRGFIQDVGGEVVESVPGRIRVRLGGKGSVYEAPQRGSLSWLGLGRRPNPINMELRLERPDDSRGSQLHITVILRPPHPAQFGDPAWRRLCTQIYCDLRGYLMGQTGVVGTEAT